MRDHREQADLAIITFVILFLKTKQDRFTSFVRFSEQQTAPRTKKGKAPLIRQTGCKGPGPVPGRIPKFPRQKTAMCLHKTLFVPSTSPELRTQLVLWLMASG